MAQAGFEVIFDGPGMESGRVSVREFASGLRALTEVFAGVGWWTGGASAIPGPSVKAIGEGRFAVELPVDGHGRGGADAVAIRDRVVGPAGLYRLVREVGGRRLERREGDGLESVRAVFEGGVVLETSAKVLGLYDNLEVRRKVRESLEPLGHEGIDRVRFRCGGEFTVEVAEADLPAYAVPELDEVPLLDRETEMVVLVISTGGVQGSRWTLSDGERTFSAAVEDPSLADRVRAGVRQLGPVRAGDMLRCRMQMVQARRGDGLRTDYAILRVDEHIPRQEQLKITGGAGLR